ncbi:AraC family transcriptional regulator [Thalassospira marina]|uniref:HTH araC/xylS-type domain-containing protein n=1 Tax=Thalassospira marina TaxID=2048283 RepID=A0ABN5FEV4_9PROT|nr:AraC family transcriptional regulator [Thalassospira marina]AUG53563.1 hypothetical protein CSC3H3_13185 [Thalassospira marina]
MPPHPNPAMAPARLTPGDFRQIASRLPRPAQGAGQLQVPGNAKPGEAAPTQPGRVEIHGLSRLGKLIFRQTETLQDYIADFPAIAYLIDGSKAVGTSADAPLDETMLPGQVLLIPAGLPLSVVNYPDLKSGQYCALVLEFSPDLIVRFTAAYPEIRELMASSPISGPSGLVFTPQDDLLRSMMAVMSLLSTAGENHDRALIRHRLMEVLLLLAKAGQAGPLLLPIASPDMKERLCALFRLAPARKWQKTQLAHHLGTSPSSLDRQLKQAGTSFRALLESERMAYAARLLGHSHKAIAQNSNHANTPETHHSIGKPARLLAVSDIAFMCGYQSQSAFARAFTRHFGYSPTQSALNMV